MTLKQALLLIFLVISGYQTCIFSQENHVVVSGVVLDVETHLPMNNAVVTIPELNLSTITGSKGTFEFKNIAHGKYSLNVSYIGFKRYSLELNVKGQDVLGIIIHLVPVPLETSAVVVTGEHYDSRFDNLYEMSNVLKGRDLERDLGTTLASTLRNETGLAIRSMGPAPARPVIRGLGSDRVTITEDGIKSNDLSATSPDHAVTVEPFTVERIEVLRGPRILLQNSSAIGGVINIIRGEIPETIPPRISGSAGLYGETVNKGYLGAAVTEIPIGRFVLRGEFSGRKTSDLYTPAGTLKNSSISNINYSGGAGFINGWGHTGVSFREYETDYGIPGGFIGGHPNGVDINMYKKDINLNLGINMGKSFMEDIKLLLSRTYYHHTEYETADIVGAEYAIYNYSGSINLNTSQIGPFKGGTIGFSPEYKDYNVGGYVFTPPTKSYKYSVFLYQKFDLSNTSFEFSARYNYDLLQPQRKGSEGELPARHFNTYSLAFSGIYEITTSLFAGATLSRSSRVPTIEELYSEGPHLAVYSYETGNPYLDDEKGFGAEIYFYHKSENLYFNLNLFRNVLDYYIIPRNTGTINYNTLLPVYQATGAGALFYGIESQADYRFTPAFILVASISYTRGSIKETDEPLPAIPPLKGHLEIKYTFSNELVTGLSLEGAAAQNRTDTFEEPTAGYFISGMFLQYSFLLSDMVNNISLNFENIFNKEYRNHLSRIKSVMPEPGRNLRLTLRTFF